MSVNECVCVCARAGRDAGRRVCGAAGRAAVHRSELAPEGPEGPGSILS